MRCASALLIYATNGINQRVPNGARSQPEVSMQWSEGMF